jgi:hypothetical protein
MVVWWRVKAMAKGVSVVLNRYGEEDNQGAVFFSGELGQLRQAQAPSSLLLPSSPSSLAWCGLWVATEWRRG